MYRQKGDQEILTSLGRARKASEELRKVAAEGQGCTVGVWAYIILWTCRSEKLFRVSDACIFPKSPKATETHNLLFAQNSHQNFIHGTVEQRKERGSDFVMSFAGLLLLRKSSTQDFQLSKKAGGICCLVEEPGFSAR